MKKLSHQKYTLYGFLIPEVGVNAGNVLRNFFQHFHVYVAPEKLIIVSKQYQVVNKSGFVAKPWIEHLIRSVPF